MTDWYCGFDFGTTNTVVTLLNAITGEQQVISDSSVLFLPDCGAYAQKRYIGSRAIEEYLGSGMNGRFIQSIKSVLPDPEFVHTLIYDKRYSPVDLVAMIIGWFRDRIADRVGSEPAGAVFGRPVRFSTIAAADLLAESRLREAAKRCGFNAIEMLPEPVAASARYAERIPAGSNAIVCDFGGGTSDFTILRRSENGQLRVLATHGVRVGGDDFDSQIMWNRLVSYFGYGTRYESYGKMLPVPVHIYRTICRWDRVPFLKSHQYREDLRYMYSGAEDKAALLRLISLIDDDLGFALFQAIRQAKHLLTDGESAAVSFFEQGIELKERIFGDQFEGYIAEELLQVSKAVAEVVSFAGIQEGKIDAAFLTGGSSLVRPIKEGVARRFPDADIHLDTDRFNSVSLGLAMHAKSLGIGLFQNG